ncbi:MAG: cation-translocating P-type ATPase [Ignavibacteria bacterium]|nr:cation-translocating P-type ATPase [Ignavibacteria bacterium]
MDYHLLSLPEVFGLLNSTPDGLKSQTAGELLLKYGKNTLSETKKKTVWLIFLGQFTDLMIMILLAAAIISAFLGDLTDALVIFTIVIINALVGFVQEYRAEKAMTSLKKMAATHAKVLRDNNVIVIASAELVPGDVIMLEAGDVVPADIRFIETHSLKVNESSITGESANIEKSTARLASGDYSLGDKINMGYKGTFVTNGRARAIVVLTGMNTELGRIATLIQIEDTMTPLQKRLNGFGKRITVSILAICTGRFVIGLLRGEMAITLLLTVLSLAVAAIPEAMPAVVTIALALGSKKLAENFALIRNLPAVETLGSVTYICTDKTGTLTENRMTVEKVYSSENTEISGIFPGNDPLLSAMVLNNDVIIDSDGTLKGESTETALVKYALENNFSKTELESSYPRIAEFPFDSIRKCMTTVHSSPGGIIVITKGAVESIASLTSSFGAQNRSEIISRADIEAANGYRVLGYALKLLQKLPDELTSENIESSLTFAGIACLIDPPRPEAKNAVEECKQAGIIPVMITGDHKLTAESIARKLGILTSEEEMTLEGKELEKLTDRAFKEIVDKVRVYARVNPEQKLRIISALQSNHHFAAMTGDGVNDAPALKNADIGISMGINGTEVSREASDMILLDDNFATIVKAVKLGRTIYSNILKFINYIMSGNTGEILAIILAPFFGLPIPLLAIHILWVNLVSDGLPGLAMAYEKPESNIMKIPPRDPEENIFSAKTAFRILRIGFLISLVTVGTEAWAINNNISNWQTMAFTVLCFSQLGLAMAFRSRLSVFTAGVFSNWRMVGAIAITVLLQFMIIYIPQLNTIFKTHPLSIRELIVTIAVSSIVFWAVEAEKFILKLRNKTL